MTQHFPLEKTYDPQVIENFWYHRWENNNYFAPQGEGPPFTIMLPPPNVTGSLHMGHGFGFTLIDVLIRYHRMCGDKTLWQGGTDHAGIATQMVVERQLNASGQNRQDLGREAFNEKIWEWKKTSGGQITQQLRRLGASIDWSRERFTLDPDLSYAVREVFIRLFDEELIYRGKRLVNWDPQLLTAISDLEVINTEEEGHLWHIRYPLVGDTTSLIVATTRPETLLGDVAVAVHPEDPRYQHLIGKQLHLPLTERTIPIIADEYVDPSFGSGCVKITPAHDFNDYAVGKRHHLEPINIFTLDAHINEEAPLAYQGLERFAARKQIVADLKVKGLLEKIEAHKLKIPRNDRSNAIVEPMLTYQWYVKSAPLAAPAIEAVEQGTLRFIPENWSKTYFQWMHNIEDWCISRQLWWGHRIPIWYDENGKAYAGHSEEDVRQRYQLANTITLTQDEDVLDTWFSSALWPFATLGWPKETPELETFFPTQTLITGFDIIFFWVARMVMMSLHFTKQVPFREVYITGLIRDAEGQKMSKSKGNVLDPIDLIDGISLEALIQKRSYGLMQPKLAKKIEKTTRCEFPDGIPSYGTDALRFTYCSFASYTREIKFDTNRLAGYRNFCNKLWNASRYVLMNVSEPVQNHHPVTFSLVDRWIQSRLQQTIEDVHAAFNTYRFDLAAQALYEFIWNEYCDWYVELSKPVLLSDESSKDALQTTRFVLINTLEIVLRLLHPIMPFITEALWQRIAPLLGKEGVSIMLANYPQVDHNFFDNEAEESIAWIKQFIIAIRSLRSEMNISPAKPVTILLKKGSHQDREHITSQKNLIFSLAKIDKLEWLNDTEKTPVSASTYVGTLEIYIPLAGFINLEEETARLQRELLKQEKELQHVKTKLENRNFIDRAPSEVIEKERKRYEEVGFLIDKIKQQLTRLGQ